MGILSNEVTGIIGCILYLFIFCFSIWQLYLYCVPWDSSIFSTRKFFHFFLALYCALQIASLYSFCLGTYYFKWTFACHLFANCCEVIAVSLVSVLWSKTLVSTSNAFKQVMPCLIVIDGSLLGYSIVVCLDMLGSKESFDDWTLDSKVFDNYLLVDPIVLVVNGLFLAYLGIRIRNRLVKDPSWAKIPLPHKHMVLFRLLGTMVVCCASFAARAIVQIYIFYQHSERLLNNPGWALSSWLPSLLPVCILTYTMRRTEVEDDSDSEPDKDPDRLASNSGQLSNSHSNSGGGFASSLASVVARAMVATPDEEDVQSNGVIQESFDNVIAPLLATTILADDHDKPEEGDGRFGSTTNPIAPFPYSRASSAMTSPTSSVSGSVVGGNVYIDRSSGRTPPLEGRGNANYQGRRDRPVMNVNTGLSGGKLNRVNLSAHNGQNLVRTKSVRSESEISDV